MKTLTARLDDSIEEFNWREAGTTQQVGEELFDAIHETVTAVCVLENDPSDEDYNFYDVTLNSGTVIRGISGYFLNF